MKQIGRFVTLEGIDGAGKTVQTKLLAERHKAQGVPLVVTREPGGGSGGKPIRKLLTGNSVDRYSPETEILLFMAARRNHIDTLIGPALTEGKLVICDRFADSTRIYQGFERPQMRRLIDQLHESVIGLEPDMTFILDLPVETAVGRIRDRGGSDARFEQFGERITALRDGFRRLATEFPNRCRIIDGTRPLNEISDELYSMTRALVS